MNKLFFFTLALFVGLATSPLTASASDIWFENPWEVTEIDEPGPVPVDLHDACKGLIALGLADTIEDCILLLTSGVTVDVSYDEWGEPTYTPGMEF